MANEVPTLSLQGWLASPAEKIDRLLMYYFTTHASQTNVFSGSLASLTYQVQQYGHRPEQLREEMIDTLREFLQPYYESVNVDVVITQPEQGNDQRYDIRMDIELVHEGVRHTAGWLIHTLNSLVENYTRINNYGEIQ